MNNPFELEVHCGKKQPAYPYKMASHIQRNQKLKRGDSLGSVGILFNKGRYFECHLPQKIAEEAERDICIENMNGLVSGPWRLLQLFVDYLNEHKIYANISVDWI